MFKQGFEGKFKVDLSRASLVAIPLTLVKEIKIWNDENLTGGWGQVSALCFWFELKSDAAKFKLRWQNSFRSL